LTGVKIGEEFHIEIIKQGYWLETFAHSEFLVAKSSLDRVPSATMDTFDGRLAQRLERPAYTGKVRGSNP
jgi:hypothetical protein